MHRLFNWLILADVESSVARAQLRELRNHLPLLYSLLIANASLLTWTYSDITPFWMSWGTFACASAVCLSRIPFWLRLRTSKISDQDVLRHLRRAVLLSGVLALLFIGWAMLLDGYGSALEHSYSAIFIATTVICSLFCLMHLPQAATMIVVLVAPVYVGYYAFAEVDLVFLGIALNVVLVVLVMMKVLFRAFHTFTTMIRSQNEIIARHLEVEKLNIENERLANTDALTELTNRRYFFVELQKWIDQKDAEFTLALLDLDKFKPINDRYGHPAGDQLLATIGGRLKKLCNKDILISRLGGDEFGVLIRLDPDQFMGHAHDTITAPVEIFGKSLSVGCSIGFARFPTSARTADELLHQADADLYANKRSKVQTLGIRTAI
ncbi:diguanylate cyclase (GGDEF)-like protein [Devosia subaequoris]|uniref:diguanylate cyclase n=1 Tax=Devosia subaequoris TaxID=395930 RepID=A0A7W6IJU7_9HYPH|nr:diguanylate cyclase [Devosia subaequoris]MBB4050942.1 diguanylate cyclase (GGDEF)-like protein [Devosia subaequoris]MCP1208389.1 diguanylate cyclase [Devosia subaequoris]